jgi:hypothetical protein
MTKTKMQEAVRELRQVYHDAIASRIQNSTKSYAEIGLELGCSEQLVYQVARLRGLCRTAPKQATETEAAHE